MLSFVRLLITLFQSLFVKEISLPLKYNNIETMGPKLIDTPDDSEKAIT